MLSLGSGLVAIAALSRALRREAVNPIAASTAVAMVACWRWTLFSSAAGAVPEMPSVALLCVALERWCARKPGSWWQTGLALTLAAGFRYEAWFALLGFALFARDRTRPRWEVAATLGISSLVPVAWLVVNHFRRGDALDFIHRVAAHRSAVTAVLAPWWIRWTEVPRALVVELPWILLLGVALWRAGPRPAVVRIGAAMAGAVLFGLALESARGGGATHHAARTLLSVAWMLVPALAVSIEALLQRGLARSIAVGALACAAWSAPHPAEVADLGAPAASVVGDMAARRWPHAPWCLERQRQDALWIEWRGTGAGQILPDRVFGSAPEHASRRADKCARARGAVTSSWELEEALRFHGFHLVGRVGPWALLERAP